MSKIKLCPNCGEQIIDDDFGFKLLLLGSWAGGFAMGCGVIALAYLLG